MSKREEMDALFGRIEEDAALTLEALIEESKDSDDAVQVLFSNTLSSGLESGASPSISRTGAYWVAIGFHIGMGYRNAQLLGEAKEDN